MDRIPQGCLRDALAGEHKLAVHLVTLVGFLYLSIKLSRVAIQTCYALRVYLWACFRPVDLSRKYGRWVMITGATDGIGLSYAREFARRGHPLILLARNKEKLERVRCELRNLLPIELEEEIVLICADLSKTTSLESYERIQSEIKPFERDIGILFNNAGVMNEVPSKFLEQSGCSVIEQCNVNMLATAMITRCVLPSMCKRKKGLVINISSMGALHPLPCFSVYSASKKFVDYFSRTLEFEYGSQGIQVQTLYPSYVATKMVHWSKWLSSRNFLTPSSDAFARAAVATIGRSSQTCGWWSHGLLWWLYTNLVTVYVWNWVSYRAHRMLNTSSRSQ